MKKWTHYVSGECDFLFLGSEFREEVEVGPFVRWISDRSNIL